MIKIKGYTFKSWKYKNFGHWFKIKSVIRHVMIFGHPEDNGDIIYLSSARNTGLKPRSILFEPCKAFMKKYFGRL